MQTVFASVDQKQLNLAYASSSGSSEGYRVFVSTATWERGIDPNNVPLVAVLHPKNAEQLMQMAARGGRQEDVDCRVLVLLKRSTLVWSPYRSTAKESKKAYIANVSAKRKLIRLSCSNKCRWKTYLQFFGAELGVIFVCFLRMTLTAHQKRTVEIAIIVKVMCNLALKTTSLLSSGYCSFWNR